ncbi:hypothetical protein P8C59_002857 [Phyllachora maydis]|uniref:Aminoacyl-transfer RNA synthetases class-II family profile domain-containing protein n=1 Tax=Phyllachora maydis TaxID=1825666 RepID=A0AAD9HZA5_9PEZI|nr:hypothetical protein P8C59_002857 [Phyllachora maydis]
MLPPQRLCQASGGHFSTAQNSLVAAIAATLFQKTWENVPSTPRTLWKQFNPGTVDVGQDVGVNGFLKAIRRLSANLVFATVDTGTGAGVQLMVRAKDNDDPKGLLIDQLRAIPLNSPITARGLVTKVQFLDPSMSPRLNPRLQMEQHRDRLLYRVDLDLTHIEALNRMPQHIVVKKSTEYPAPFPPGFPAQSRHLQLRFSDRLHNRILFRDSVANRLRELLRAPGLCEIETPLLFKSTPEGAREFLVPSRRHGHAYALPQSPQQFKQILMASGFRGYYQFARCFRDEDLRADRQPEFTQVDLEMAFATGSDVQELVEKAITKLQNWLNVEWVLHYHDRDLSPFPRNEMARVDKEKTMGWHSIKKSFPHLRYDHAMKKYGTDKPDLRIPFHIRRVEHVLPEHFIRMITNLEKPMVEAFVVKSELHLEYHKPMDDGPPTMLVFDPSMPLDGLSSLDHDGVKKLQCNGPGLEDFAHLEKGDALFFQAREDKPFQGEGSTAMGTLRKLVYDLAVQKRFVQASRELLWLWVTHFPMFTPDTKPGEGQQGLTGLKATHHPFTAPMTPKDFALMATDPLQALADHYDLVVNGVEIGGGSRRIHLADMQKHVLRNILGMPADGIKRFHHLLEALRAGCPPHAGFALGLDRLVAVLSYADSVRDVMAFPKSMKGQDPMTQSPGPVSDAMLAPYHMKLVPSEGTASEETASEDDQGGKDLA